MSEPDHSKPKSNRARGPRGRRPRVGIVMGSKSDMPAMEKAAKELTDRGILHEVRVMSAHRDPEMVAEYAKNARMRGIKVIIAGAGLVGRAAGRGRRAHRPAGDRRAADVVDVDRGRARRAALDRADAARRAGGVRGRGQRPQRRSARGPHPRACDRSLHPARDRGHLDRRGPLRRHARRRGRGRRGAGRPDGGGARRDPRGDLHGRRDQRAREDPRPRHGGVRRRAGRLRGARRALDPLRPHVLRRRRYRAGAAAQAGG